MRDIRSDLQERAAMVQQWINAEDAQFETLRLQVKTEYNGRVETLKAELRAVHKLIDFASWQQNMRAALLLATATAEAAEVSAKKALQTPIPG